LSNNLPYLQSSENLQNLLDRILSSSNSVNQFGFSRADLGEKLCQYLDYGNFHNTDSLLGTSLGNTATSDYTQRALFTMACSPFPLFAYHKIYQDYVRNSQWEKAKPYLWNVDYSTGGILSIPSSGDPYYDDETLVDLHYWNWNKDLFMGVLPNTQYGDVAAVNISLPSSTIPIKAGTSGATSNVYTTSIVNVNAAGDAFNINGAGTNFGSMIKGASANLTPNSQLTAQLSSLSSAFNVLQLRMAECLQRWKEIAQSGSQDFRSQIKKHFNIDVPEGLSNMCEFLGGQNGNLDISEVLNNNITGDQQANIAGKGVGSGSGQAFRRQFNDYGILMGIYHNVPLLDYVITGQKKEALYTQATDFAIPELDSIGMEQLPFINFQNSYLIRPGNTYPLTVSSTLGYAPRYYELKTNVDRIHGAFTTTLLDWVAPVGQKYLKDFMSTISTNNPTVATYKFFKVNPSLLNSIFTVAADSKWDTDQFLINMQINIKAVRPFDYDGMPY
jgi:hypothetical protein